MFNHLFFAHANVFPLLNPLPDKESVFLTSSTFPNSDIFVFYLRYCALIHCGHRQMGWFLKLYLQFYKTNYYEQL